jgi:hypothetical protein
MTIELTNLEFIQLCDTNFDNAFRYYVGEGEANKIEGSILEQLRRKELQDYLSFLKTQMVTTESAKVFEQHTDLEGQIAGIQAIREQFINPCPHRNALDRLLADMRAGVPV